MRSPLIGVTSSLGENEYGLPIVYLLRAYMTALNDAGGAPVLIPPGLTEEALQTVYARLDGILFPGGGDIAIQRFEGKSHPKIDNVQPERDELEFSLLDAAVAGGKPFLGICRGIQVINVGLGGSLYTHIEDQVPQALKHDYYPDFPRTHLAHQVRIEAGTQLGDILGETRLTVNSLHHQGIKDLAPSLVKVGVASDGLLEAVELPGHPFGIAVQWHPEWLIDQIATQRLFKAFIEKASKHK